MSQYRLWKHAILLIKIETFYKMEILIATPVNRQILSFQQRQVVAVQRSTTVCDLLKATQSFSHPSCCYWARQHSIYKQHAKPKPRKLFLRSTPCKYFTMQPLQSANPLPPTFLTTHIVGTPQWNIRLVKIKQSYKITILFEHPHLTITLCPRARLRSLASTMVKSWSSLT